MKLIILLSIIPFFVNAQTLQERKDILKTKDVRLLKYLCNYQEPNAELFLNSASDLEVSCLESKLTEAAEMVFKQSEISKKLSDRRFGEILYANVQVLNESKGLSKVQRRTIRSSLSSIRDDLIDGNICDAKADISAISPDGVLITQSDLDNVINEINGYKSCD